jgi:hypothetical protein
MALSYTVAGPNRPIPQSLPPGPQLGNVKRQSDGDKQSALKTAQASPGFLQQMQGTGSALYNRLGAAVNERG